jgi:sugar phosphate isomerase/epimerase
MQVGVMFWADRDHLADVKALGVSTGQLGVSGGYDLSGAVAADWSAALRELEFTVVTVFAAYNGESYDDIPTVERTVGFVPALSRAERERRTYAVSDFAAALGVASIACHIGFVPEDPGHPDYLAVRDLVRRVCDHAAAHGQTFALETGQEPAPVLLEFLRSVDRPNLGINFDPANMILYGTGDPIEALGILAPHILSVHVKDGDWPPPDQPGTLGAERPLGEGAVGIPRYVAKLKEIGFRGPLNIEREAHDPEQRRQDLARAVAYLKRLVR